MTRNIEQDWQSRREVPDRQIRGAADQYEEARKLLNQLPPGSGVVLPLINTATMAIELYLKCLCAETIHIPINNGTGVSLVHSEPVQRGHKLVQLLDTIDGELQTELNQVWQESDLASANGLRSDLEQMDGAFAASRYPFGPDSDPSDYNLSILMALSSFLSAFVAGLKPSETIVWEDGTE